jgi:hypothetical protein
MTMLLGILHEELDRCRRMLGLYKKKLKQTDDRKLKLRYRKFLFDIWKEIQFLEHALKWKRKYSVRQKESVLRLLIPPT